ncbi:MAG: GDP-mannose 4,6-dehydratase [Methanoregula sp.]|jgi:CDP-glucose 4,6-dehydratase|uniref:GDP-mannose 4,6-dehydratase n=1 Tax=Methanoregula sp. TaxID=2052170 RepID=UPI003D0BED58
MKNEHFWRNRPVFITGCTGLLGSWMSQALAERGAQVTGLIRDTTPQSHLYRSGTINKITTVRGEIEDYALIERVLNEYEIETVFHLGAQTIVTTANRGPISTFKSNIEGTWNILEASRNVPTVRRIVVASSDKAYGDQKNLPYDESTPLEGRHPYDVSKSCADLLCRCYFETYNLPVCVTRCGNFYGGGDLNYNRIVPGTIRSVYYNENPVIRSDGTFLRDYFYIRDGVESYLHLAEKMDDKRFWGEAFNFSTESPKSVIEIVNDILRIMKSPLKPVVLNQATNEIKDQYLSAQKARKMLNWSPGYAYEEGLKETIEWYRDFFKMQVR